MRIREIVFNNLPIKIISLLLAFFLWFFVIGQRSSEIGIEVPIRFENLNENLAIINKPNTRVDIRVRGPRTLLSSLDPTRVDLTVDLSQAREGRRVYHIFPEQIVLPRGLQVSRIEPSEIIFEFSAVVTKELAVKPIVDGTAGEGYKISQVTALPQTVILTGAAEELKQLKEIRTEQVPIKGRKKPFRLFVPLEVEGLHLTRIDPRRVEVAVDIVKHMVKRWLKEVPIKVVGAEEGTYSIKPERIDLLVFGHEIMLDELKSNDIKVYLEASGLTPGKYRRRVIIDLPDDISLFEARPPWFTLEIRP